MGSLRSYAKNIFESIILFMIASLAFSRTSQAQDNSVTAIDIALEPDQTMNQHAKEINASLLKAYPKGYALDATHRPHITVLQRYVRTSDLEKVYQVVGDLLKAENPGGWILKGYKLSYGLSSGMGITFILIERNNDLLRFQEQLISAIRPFSVDTSNATAFVTTKEEPVINQQTLDWVAHFVPASSGEKYVPHVTVGVAPEEEVKQLVAGPFVSFQFSPVATIAYQLGNFGTARKVLKSWPLK